MHTLLYTPSLYFCQVVKQKLIETKTIEEAKEILADVIASHTKQSSE
jgi:hypothetical protein